MSLCKNFALHEKMENRELHRCIVLYNVFTPTRKTLDFNMHRSLEKRKMQLHK